MPAGFELRDAGIVTVERYEAIAPPDPAQNTIP
jgi:hypothetical protein